MDKCPFCGAGAKQTLCEGSLTTYFCGSNSYPSQTTACRMAQMETEIAAENAELRGRRGQMNEAWCPFDYLICYWTGANGECCCSLIPPAFLDVERKCPGKRKSCFDRGIADLDLYCKINGVPYGYSWVKEIIAASKAPLQQWRTDRLIELCNYIKYEKIEFETTSIKLKELLKG